MKTNSFISLIHYTVQHFHSVVSLHACVSGLNSYLRGAGIFLVQGVVLAALLLVLLVINLQLLSNFLYTVLLHQLRHAKCRELKRKSALYFIKQTMLANSIANLLVLGDGVQKLGVEFGIVLGQRFMAVVIDELHHRQEGERL